MRKPLLVGVITGLLIAAGVLVAIQLADTNETASTEESDVGSTYKVMEEARDGDVVFRVPRAECFDEDGEHVCIVHLDVKNKGAQEIGPLDPLWQVLRLENGNLATLDEDRMRAYGEDYGGSRTAFNRSIPAGESNSAYLIYSGVQPNPAELTLELHSAEDSEGVVIEIKGCDLVHTC